MQTLKNLPQEGQQAIAQSLGYNGNLEGFPKYLMSNPSVAQEYTALEDAFQKHQQFTQVNKKMTMAQGGYTMDRFDQNQQQDMVGAYVPPPQQSFAFGGATITMNGPCNHCGGTGYIGNYCRNCSGAGYVEKDLSYNKSKFEIKKNKTQSTISQKLLIDSLESYFNDSEKTKKVLKHILDNRVLTEKTELKFKLNE